VLFVSVLLFSCSVQNEAVEYKDRRMAVITNAEDINWTVAKDHKLFIPDKSDFAKVDFVLEKALLAGEFKFLENQTLKGVKNRYRQYVFYLDDNADKVVFVNSFCEIPLRHANGNDEEFNWRNNILDVSDGGKCYWHMKINLTAGTYSRVATNGYGFIYKKQPAYYYLPQIAYI